MLISWTKNKIFFGLQNILWNQFQTDISGESDKIKNRRSASFLKTESREVSDRDLSDVSEDMQVKSKLLVSFLASQFKFTFICSIKCKFDSYFLLREFLASYFVNPIFVWQCILISIRMKTNWRGNININSSHTLDLASKKTLNQIKILYV